MFLTLARARLTRFSPLAVRPLSAGGKQSVRMYEPQAAELLMKLGLSVAEGPLASPEAAAEGPRVVPVEGVQALSAAMSLIGGDAGVSADVRFFFFVWVLYRVFLLIALGGGLSLPRGREL